MSGTTTLKKLLNGGTPRLTEASSMESRTLCSGPTAARTLFGMRRRKYASAMIIQVPVSTSQPVLKVFTSAMPSTVPAMVRGSITSTSRVAVAAERRFTTR
jgi:hypothetical protein